MNYYYFFNFFFYFFWDSFFSQEPLTWIFCWAFYYPVQVIGIFLSKFTHHLTSYILISYWRMKMVNVMIISLGWSFPSNVKCNSKAIGWFLSTFFFNLIYIKNGLFYLYVCNYHRYLFKTRLPLADRCFQAADS